MQNIHVLPTRITVPSRIKLNDYLTVEKGPLGVTELIGRDHPELSATIRVILGESSFDAADVMNTWIAYHTLASDSPKTYAYYHRRTAVKFSVLSAEGNVREFNLDDILHDLYDLDPAVKLKRRLSYAEAFQRFEAADYSLYRAIETYMLVRSIRMYPHLIPVETARWMIAMLISAMEYLMPKLEPCSGNCDACGGSPHHIAARTSDDLWDELIFNKIPTKKSKSAYRNTIITARNEIRNLVVHDGGVVEAHRERAVKKKHEEHLTIADYDTATAADLHSVDVTALDTLFQHTVIICRYVLLNAFIGLNIFPDLPLLQQYTYTLTTKENGGSLSINYDSPRPNAQKITPNTTKRSK